MARRSDRSTGGATLPASIVTSHAAHAAPDADHAVPLLARRLERRQCQSGEGWRIVTVENNAIGHSRTLWMVDELSPTPEQAVNQARRLWAERTLGIGYCAPGRSVDERGARAGDVSLWLASKRGAPVRVEPGEILDPPLAELGEVYFAPPDQLALNGSWPAGIYLFQVSPGSAADASAAGWFALDVRRVRPR